uniref:Uncharacterized protein n=1 Tax=Timema cristinae TaxID=61476 RepID=A0A7R9CWL8_TIMCR|nr:unnamed protein product [Timema cristinae]
MLSLAFLQEESGQDNGAGVLRSDNLDHGSTSNLSCSPPTTHDPPPLQETESPYTDWQTQGNDDCYNRQQHQNNTEVAWYGQESQFTPEQSQFTPEQSQFTPEQSQFTPEQSQFTPEQSQFTPEQYSQHSWRQDPQTSTPLTDWSQSGLTHTHQQGVVSPILCSKYSQVTGVMWTGQSSSLTWHVH